LMDKRRPGLARGIIDVPFAFDKMKFRGPDVRPVPSLLRCFPNGNTLPGISHFVGLRHVNPPVAGSAVIVQPIFLEDPRICTICYGVGKSLFNCWIFLSVLIISFCPTSVQAPNQGHGYY